MSSPAAPLEFHPYGLPLGTVRGFLSVLICSFFWIVLLYPPGNPPVAPLGHYFLLVLVFMAFASNPLPDAKVAFLPWLMRFIFVGGTLLVVGYLLVTDPQRLTERLTPRAEDITQWPVLLGCLTAGFGGALVVRYLLGRNSEVFLTARAWIGIIAILLLLFETLFQFAILPYMSDRPSADALKVWEGALIVPVAAYFGSRA